MIIEIQKSELENLIRQRMATGEFENVEDALLDALKSPSTGEKSPEHNPTKKSLGQFLLESPLPIRAWS